MIEVLRLGHRAHRDYRISTHVALTARAFGASKLYYSGDKDDSFEESVMKVVKKFGGNFEVEYVRDYSKLLSKRVVHLTMYGLDYRKKINDLIGKDLLIVVGGEKVSIEMYDVGLNLSVTNQPISEVSALGIFLSSLNLKGNFINAKVKIDGSLKGKKVVKG